VISPRLTMLCSPAIVAFRPRDNTDTTARQTHPSTTAREEGQKEEVLAVFRELAGESRSQGEAREYVPWQPLW